MSNDDRPGYDPMSGPLPSEIAASSQTEVVPRPRPEAPTGRSKRRVAVRRQKRTLRHVDPISILKLSLFFYAVFLVIWLIFVAVVYSILDSMGLFNELETILGPDGFVLTDFELSLSVVERWAFLIGATFVVVGSIVNVFIAFLYNVASDLVGGVEMTFVERDL